MDATLIEVNLPNTGGVVKMSQFLTTGQSRELQLLMLQGSKIKPGNTEMGDIPADTFLRMQDRAAEMIIKEVIAKDGSPVSIPVLEWLYALPISDGNVVYDKVNELIQASSLTEEQKKK